VARTLLDEAETLIPPTCRNVEKAGLLVAKAEVNWLAGAPDQTEASLRAALQIYEDLHVVPLADLARTGPPRATSTRVQPSFNLLR
jgi:hypothetical protein